jgi:hypothetical protein
MPAMDKSISKILAMWGIHGHKSQMHQELVRIYLYHSNERALAPFN